MALSTISGTTGITDATITSAKLADFAAAVDLNGVELLLDADQDTSITADTDDRIDFKLGGVEHISLNNSSGDTVIKPMVDGKDIVFQQYDGNKILEINDGNYVAISGAAAGPGELRFYEDTDLGSHYTGLKAGNATASISYVLPLADGSSGQHLSTDGSGTLSWSTPSANTPSSADGQALGSASLEWSDLFLADASTIQFGADQDVTLTHVHNTGLLLNSTMAIQFNDASQYINAPSNAILDINATDEIELNATLVDINANVEISGTATTTGVHTFTAVPVFPNNTVETADIQDNAVSLAKMAGLARGKIIYGDSSGDPAALAVGSNGQALVSDGTDISWGAAGASLSGSTNNTVATVTGANALAGEANLTFDGSTLAVTGAATVSGGSSGATATSEANELVIEDDGACGLSILSATDNYGVINFGDSGDADIGRIRYNHTDNSLAIRANGNEEDIKILSDKTVCIGHGSNAFDSGRGSNLFVKNNHDDGFAATFYNEGNRDTRHGIGIACGYHNASGTNRAIDFFDGDYTLQGSITFQQGTVQYGAFTANHDVELPDADNAAGYDYGTLLEITELFYKTQKDGTEFVRGIRYKVQKSSSAYSKSVLGAYAGKYALTASDAGTANLHQVYVLGDGHILCNREKGNIAVGDGICASATDGIGMKADKTAMIIGIAQEAVSFSDDTPKLVAVQYGLQQFTPWE